MRFQALVFCFPVFALAAFAQSRTGAIEGTVRNPTGGPQSGASVQARNTASGAVFKSAASSSGAYTVSNLPPGAYDVSVSVPALTPFNHKNLAVQAGQTARLDIRLQETTQLSTLGEDTTAVSTDMHRHHPPSGPTPRTFDGKPDLSGVWWSPATVDPGKPEFLAWAQKVADERTGNLRKDTPQAYCLPSAVTRIGPLYEFVQSKNIIVEISDDDSPGFHQIYVDGRGHPEDPNPQWYGDSIGHWEGDTLVVDRVAFDERVWLDQGGHPHTDKLHVTERYRRPDLGHLETEITVEDPGTLAKPWTMKRVSELAPSERIYEFICPEDNKDVAHLRGK